MEERNRSQYAPRNVERNQNQKHMATYKKILRMTESDRRAVLQASADCRPQRPPTEFIPRISNNHYAVFQNPFPIVNYNRPISGEWRVVGEDTLNRDPVSIRRGMAIRMKDFESSTSPSSLRHAYWALCKSPRYKPTDLILVSAPCWRIDSAFKLVHRPILFDYALLTALLSLTQPL